MKRRSRNMMSGNISVKIKGSINSLCMNNIKEEEESERGGKEEEEEEKEK